MKDELFVQEISEKNSQAGEVVTTTTQMDQGSREYADLVASATKSAKKKILSPKKSVSYSISVKTVPN